MLYVALRMLMGDTTRYLALCLGIAFSVTLVIQQGSIFTGILRRAASNVESVPQADLWVMYPGTRYYDERKAIPDTAVNRVRGVTGVDWAEPLLVGSGSALLPDGNFAFIQVVGVERVSKIGLPHAIDAGDPENLSLPDAVMWDNAGLKIYESIQPGDVIEINDRRARIVGLASAPRRLTGGAVVYTTYERALDYSPGERNRLTFVVVKVKAGFDSKEVAASIEQQTGLQARTGDEFFWQTVFYFLRNTGIPINFGITVLLGIIVGIAVAGQTFYSFIAENTKNFGALKAMGVNNRTLRQMVLMQAMLVGLIGWGLGAGAAAAFGINITQRSTIAFMMTPQLLVISFTITMLTVLLVAMVSIRRVIKVEPAIVFR